jgi:EAL domain-containing protein (putative c-di-GMP-specific phosphodiesterase class I)
MYRAKARGGSQIAVFDAEMRTKQRTDEALRASLLHAISNNGFGIAAQPIFELATGRIHGVELFIRVRDDTPYIADANQLFRLAHEYGEAFDAAVLGRGLALAQTWERSLGRDAPRVQINISTQSLASSQFTRRVADALRADALRPGAIAFEIDGRDLASSGDRERNTVDELRQIGVPMIVDGFSDGSLSLNDLVDWQPAMVKLAADTIRPQVLAGLIRGVSSLRIPTTVKNIGADDELRRAVRLGAFAGQGNVLTPVRSLARIHTQVHGPQRLGF